MLYELSLQTKASNFFALKKGFVSKRCPFKVLVLSRTMTIVMVECMNTRTWMIGLAPNILSGAGMNCNYE